MTFKSVMEQSEKVYQKFTRGDLSKEEFCAAFLPLMRVLTDTRRWNMPVEDSEEIAVDVIMDVLARVETKGIDPQIFPYVWQRICGKSSHKYRGNIRRRNRELIAHELEMSKDVSEFEEVERALLSDKVNEEIELLDLELQTAIRGLLQEAPVTDKRDYYLRRKAISVLRARLTKETKDA